MDFGGHDRVETHGTVHMLGVEYADGTRTVTLTQSELLPQGGNLELHWACIFEGSDEWCLPPDGAVLPDGTNDSGDGKASRTPFGGDGKLVLSFPPGVGEDIERVVGIVVRNNADWLHADVGDLAVPLKTPSSSGVLKALSVAEKPGSGSLFERFCRINDKLSESQQAGPAGAAAIFAVMRLSAIRQLPWYAGGNYQGKDMAHMQEVVARRMALASKTAEDGMARQFYRATLATLPRGGGNGDDIRLGILQLMRENGIKEGHRPGIEDPFIAQWHQKLHSNTTVDDIYICEAYLHFLHTGNWDDFWTHLYDNHGLTREDLASMKAGWRTEGILGPGNHLPQLINPMKHFYWILRITHGGGNMDSAMDFARGNMPEDVQYEIDDMLANRDEPWVPNKIVELRERLSGTWRYGDDCNRDVVLLDIAMEKFFRNKIEGLSVAGMTPDERLGQLEFTIRNVMVGQDFDRMAAAFEFFRKVNGDCGLQRWGPEWSKVMDAALEGVSLAMEHHMDQMCELSQYPADVIGMQAECDESYILNFGEEVVRGHSMFAVSKMLGETRPTVRQAAGRSPWDIAAMGKPEISLHAGKVTVVSLEDIQGMDYSADPVVVLSARLGGLEDIPPGVTAVITASPVDLLSHIAIRARQTGVLLAAMPDPGGWADLMTKNGEGVKIDVVGEELVVSASELGVAAAASVAGPPTGQYIEGLALTPKKDCDDWVVGPEKYAEGIVGGKSSSLSALGFSTTLSTFGLMSETMKVGELRVPSSSALPFNAFERALLADEATLEKVALAAAAVSAADDSGDADLRRDALEVLRDVVKFQLKMPAELAAPLAAAAASYGGACSADDVYAAVKKVWASKWNERAYLSRKACGVDEEELHMATLLMEVVPAEFAFVLHTANPLNGDQTEVFGEVCVGLGEALVGNEPGSALSFVAKKAPGFPATVRNLPSKQVSHHPPEGAPTIIARSDSNGEDLEGFAGAGLYDSVTVAPTVERVVNYAENWLVWDEARRTALMAKLAELAVAIEVEMKAPQDIEGCVVGDDIYVLQSRNQVL